MSNIVLMDLLWGRLKHGVGSWYRDLRSHQELMDLDDRTLRDIGLSRGDPGCQDSRLYWMPDGGSVGVKQRDDRAAHVGEGQGNTH